MPVRSVPYLMARTNGRNGGPHCSIFKPVQMAALGRDRRYPNRSLYNPLHGKRLHGGVQRELRSGFKLAPLNGAVRLHSLHR